MEEKTNDLVRRDFLSMPKHFWVTLAGLAGIVLCMVPNWINATVDYNAMYQGTFIRNIPVRFNLLNLFTNYGDTGVFFLFDEDLSKYNSFRILGYAVAVMLILSAAMLISSLITHRSKIFIKFSLGGFGLAVLSTLTFMLATIILTGEPLTSGLTLLPAATMVIALVSMPFLLDPTEVKNKTMSKFLHQKAFFFMIVPIMVYVFIFFYYPLQGWQMAFQNFQPGKETEWVGWHQFERLFTDGHFWRVMQNTLGMSIINMVLSFSTAIFLALMMNEIRRKIFKRTVQTISYLPHFLSWVIAASMITSFLASDGILNQIMVSLGIWSEPRLILADADGFWWLIGWSGVWKSVGWNTIIYLAAITAIDPELYESAELDGAGRFAKMWHITLPGIKSTILVLVIMSIGWILNTGYEVQYLLSNDLTWDKAETIDVFAIRYGIRQRNYSLATAFGMFKTVVSIILIAGANFVSKRFANESLV